MAEAVSVVNPGGGHRSRVGWASSLAIAVVAVGMAWAAEPVLEPPKGPTQAAWAAVRYLRFDYLPGVGEVAGGTYLAAPAAAMAVAGALVPALDDHDGDIRETIRRRRPLGSFGAGLGDGIGHPGALFAYPIAAAAAGYAADRPRLIATARAMMEALSVASGSAFVLKLAVGRERPDRSNRLSFPSNHAAGSFALAATVARRHGWVPGVPALLLAGFVAYSRLEEDKHFFTDTLFGAVLGSAAGWAAAEAADRRSTASRTEAPPNARSWQIFPAVFRRGGGIGASVSW
jgi:membrane-associated phospholipid phosphatase